MKRVVATLCLGIALLGHSATAALAATEHLVFLRGTPQETHVWRITGREPGPVVMLLGGIHGDEPGAYVSADCYAAASLKKGSLLVVPRSNFRAITHNQRGYGGDMNRKFTDSGSDPELTVVALLKSLMAESDMVLTLHDGSGFYRPEWESEAANPKRYGQSIIIDAGSYRHKKSGRSLELAKTAQAVIDAVNIRIADPLHRFHLFNMETGSDDSPHKEHRNSATWYSMTRLGVPAYCIETSKQLPSLREKVYQHNLVINAFLEMAGVEMDQPFLPETARFSHLVITVNDGPPLAVAAGQYLEVAEGDRIRVLKADAFPERGILVSRDETGLDEARGQEITVTSPFELSIRSDTAIVGRVGIRPVEAAPLPRVTGTDTALAFASPGQDADLATLPGTRLVALAEAPDIPLPPEPGPADTPGQKEPASEPETGPDRATGTATGFLVKVDGREMVIPVGGELAIRSGAKLTLVDILSDSALPSGVVMNLRGFVSKGNELVNTGEDRGATADTGRDMLPAFSEDRQGHVYAINAELGKVTLASCRIKLVQPRLKSVTVLADGRELTLTRGSRTLFSPGQSITFVRAELEGGLSAEAPRYTLAGKEVSSELPQALTMREIAINLAVFDGDTLLGKVTWVPKRAAGAAAP